MLYYAILGIVVAGYFFASGYWVAQDRYQKKIAKLERELYIARKRIPSWRFPHAPDDH